MPDFNENGLLTPSSSIVISVPDFRKFFVEGIESNTRKEIFDKYILYSNELKKVLKLNALKQWINGSFVTQVPNPKDIDLVTFVDVDLRFQYEAELKQFEAKEANEYFGVDAYLVTVFPEGHEKIFLFESDRGYWMDKFSRTRRDRRGVKHTKGFLEILY